MDFFRHTYPLPWFKSLAQLLYSDDFIVISTKYLKGVVRDACTPHCDNCLHYSTALKSSWMWSYDQKNTVLVRSNWTSISERLFVFHVVPFPPSSAVIPHGHGTAVPHSDIQYWARGVTRKLQVVPQMTQRATEGLYNFSPMKEEKQTKNICLIKIGNDIVHNFIL